jgi:hypothetical protein
VKQLQLTTEQLERRSRLRPLLIPLAVVALASCGDDATGPSEMAIQTLATNLEYPTGLWIAGDTVYLTETAGRNTVFGGKVALDGYDLDSGELSLIVDSPENSDAVVVASDGKIYLTSYVAVIPGQEGAVSVVDPTTGDESPVTGLKIASTDMFIDDNQDIYVIGASYDPNASSLYRLPAADYADTSVVASGLGTASALTKAGSDIYYADVSRIYRLDESGTATPLLEERAVFSLTLAEPYLYFAQYTEGYIGRLELQTLAVDTVAANLDGPRAVRYDEQSGVLYFLESGTTENEFKDGALKVIVGLP